MASPSFVLHTRVYPKFPDWPPGAITANGTALSHYVQLYRYFVSQSSAFCCHNPLCCFSTNVYCCLSPQSGNFWIHPRIFNHKVYRINRYIFKHWASQSFLCAQNISVWALLVARCSSRPHSVYCQVLASIYFTYNALCSSDDSVTKLVHILHLVTIKSLLQIREENGTDLS
jgi:hypothetical protein